MGASVVFFHQYPGKYAFNVLAGALESRADTREVPLDFPRTLDGVVESARRRLAEGRRVLVAWSFYSPGFGLAAEQLRAFRAAVPEREVLTIAGGVHASAESAETLGAGFDFVAIGEGERTLAELVSRLDRGEPVDPGMLRASGPPVVLDDFPAFAPGHYKYGAIEITRGCIYACRFCQTLSFSRARFRHRSPANVRHWAGELARGGNRDVRFITPTSLSYGSSDETVNLGAVEELLSGIRQEIGPERRLFYGTFPSEVRPEHVTPEAMRLLRRLVNNDNLIIGGQSGSERLLAESHRGHDVASVLRAAEIARTHGFVPNVDFIFGLPGETPEDAQQTLVLMERLVAVGARVHGHTFMPLPGTPFRRAAPGRIDPVLRRSLERLSSRGAVYGQWRSQGQIEA